MNRNVIGFIGVVFALLMVGLYFQAEGVGLPFVRQVTNAEGSAIDLTDDKVWLLIILVAVVLGNIAGMAATLYVVMWFLNREVTRVNQQPAEPFKLLSTGADGSTAGATLTNNALYVVVGLGVVMILATVLVLVAA